MSLTYKAIGGGAYEERAGGRPTGRFWERYWKTNRGADGKPVRVRTRRLLVNAKNRRQAIGLVSLRDPRQASGKFVFLAETYRAAGCPNKKCIPCNPLYRADEERRITQLIAYFGEFDVDEMRGGDWHGYFLHRVKTVRKGHTGFRTVDKERQTMRNIFNYACATGKLNANPFAFGTAKYQSKDLVKHSTARAPVSADDIHTISAHLLARVGTEPAGWFVLFAMFTGCRVSELLRLRTDAKQTAADVFEPGFIQVIPGETESAAPRMFLRITRSKRGVNPRVVIGPEFSAMIKAFQNWHAARWQDCPWYFPNEIGDGPICRRMAHKHITSACAAIGLSAVTPHGFRSYFVSKHRSDRVDDTIIASWLGDKTVSLMQDTYGKIPESWAGGKPLGWLPSEGDAAWAKWNSDKPAANWIHGGIRQKTEVFARRSESTVAGVAKWQTHGT